MSSPASLCEICRTPLEKRGSGFFCPACVLRELMEEPDPEAETQITEAPAVGDMPRVPRHSMIEKIGEGGFGVAHQASSAAQRGLSERLGNAEAAPFQVEKAGE